MLDLSCAFDSTESIIYGVGLGGFGGTNNGKYIYKISNIARDTVASGNNQSLLMNITCNPTEFNNKNTFIRKVTLDYTVPNTADAHTLILNTSENRGASFSARETKTVASNLDLAGNLHWSALGRFKSIVFWLRVSLNSTSPGTAHQFKALDVDAAGGRYYGL